MGNSVSVNKTENETVSSKALPTQGSHPVDTAEHYVENEVSGGENDTHHDAPSCPSDLKITGTLSTQISTDSYAYSENNQEVAVTPKSDGYCSRLFQSPNKQSITYENLNISPGCKIPLAETEQRIINDKIIKILEAERDFKIKQCLLFLYANEFFWNKSPEDRIRNVKDCVLNKSCLERLYRISVSDHTDMFIKTDNAFEAFCNVAATVEVFFNPEPRASNAGLAKMMNKIRTRKRKVVGTGFSKEPFLRVQTSSNCFLVAVCVWYTLILQDRKPNDKLNEKPVDVARAARKYLLKDDDDLLNRVVHNKGRKAIELLKKMIERDVQEDWDSVLFNLNPRRQAIKLGEIMLQNLETYGVGILTNFSVQSDFKVKDKEKKDGLGYWKFDALDIDCVGEWVSLQPETKKIEELKRMREQWNDRWTKNRNAQDERMKGRVLFKSESKSDEVGTQPNTSRNQNGDEQCTHAMVVLGGYKDKNKFFFFLLNWWAKMPLVLVSADYLKACGCRVYFLMVEPEKDEVERKDAQYAECNFPDGGEYDDGSFPFPTSVDGV